MEQREQKREVATKTNKTFNDQMMLMVNDMAKKSACELSTIDKNYAMEMISTTYKRLKESGTNVNEVDFVGCNFPGQVKRFARLGLSLNESELYLDLRNNSRTGKKDVNLKMQYQGEEKLLIKYCDLHGGITKIVKDVVMEGEELTYSRDMATGDIKVTDHKIPNIFKRDISYENRAKMQGAYAIAYHKDGAQTFVYIDMNRVNRAMEASASKEKTIYKKDFMKMVLKTASHELYKTLKGYNVIPDDLQRDYLEAQLGVDEVENDIKANANSEAIDVEVHEKEQKQLEEVTVNNITGEVIKEKEPVTTQTQMEFEPSF